MKYTLLALLLLPLGLLAQTAPAPQDTAAILEQCGCHEVTFNFAETFVYTDDEAYQGSPNYRSGGLELVIPVVVDDQHIVLQHLLIVGDGMVIKHWRQDWIYEAAFLTDYVTTTTHNGELVQQFAGRKSEHGYSSGTWTQKVYQVDDSPRYQGTGRWVHNAGTSFWEAYAPAPLPRREYTKRDDYNHMLRRNRHEITSWGWQHEQDNQKLLVEGDETTRLADEKGLNTYRRVPMEQCQAAIDWWASQKHYWADVREVWKELMAPGRSFYIRKSVDGKPLFSHLFALGDELANNDAYESSAAQNAIREAIMAYYIPQE